MTGRTDKEKMTDMERMEELTKEMTGYICGSLCRHSGNGGLSQEELEEICERCPVEGFVCRIQAEYDHADSGGPDPGPASRKLRICYLSDIPSRIENCRRIIQDMEAGNISGIRKDGFYTGNAVYRFINCGCPEEYAGVRADQIILDYRFPMTGIAERMLSDSCVPERYRMIDDRSIGAFS